MEAAGAGPERRPGRRVRAREIATVASGVFLLLTALPETSAPYREGLLVTFALLMAHVIVFSRLLPPGTLGRARPAVGGTVVQLIAVYMLVVTGGVTSPWFAFYLLPVLGTVFGYRPRATALIAAVGIAGLVLVAFLRPLDDGSTIDRLMVRLLEIGAVGSIAYVVTRTMRAHREGLEQREQRLSEALAVTEREALTDPLTGAHNRRSLDRQLAAFTNRSAREDRPYSVLLLDFDGLKGLNDRSGHAAGDEALRLIARAATDVVRAYDVVARFGGDEFVVALEGTGGAEARRTAGRIQARLAELVRGQDRLAGTGVSIGIATWRPEAMPSDLLAEADADMYGTRREQRDRVNRPDP